MKKLFKHIETLRGKPHHVRRRIAIGSATFGSALIAFVWLVGSLVTGAFAIKPSSFADVSQGNAVVATSGTSEQVQPVAGVGAASIIQTQNTKPHIEIVDTTASSSSKKQAEPTVIAF